MKIRRIAIHSLALCLVFGLPIAAWAGSKLIPTHRIASPPSGKALVNFHRPTAYGGNERVPIFDGTGKMLIDLPGKSEFQVVCDPGEQLFIAWADHVSVVKADLAADKTYDIMVDVGMGWMEANIRLMPLSKDDPRRAKLDDFERRERHVWAMERNKHVIDYEAKNQERVQQIKKDFIAGEKSDRMGFLSKSDCR
jgi:hypothetical protein